MEEPEVLILLLQGGSVTRREAVLIGEFASALGWPPPRELRHRAPPPWGEIVWFESCLENGATLQINSSPEIAAGVRSSRHGIFTGFHELQCGNSRLGARAAAFRLRSIMEATVFLRPDSRRLFRIAFPNFCGWTWHRIRTDTYPGLALPEPGTKTGHPQGDEL